MFSILDFVVLQNLSQEPDGISGDGRRFHWPTPPFFTSEEKVAVEVSLVNPSVHQRCRSVFIVSLVLSQTDEVHWAKIKPVLFHPWPFLTHGLLLGAVRKHTQVFRPDWNLTQMVDWCGRSSEKKKKKDVVYFFKGPICKNSHLVKYRSFGTVRNRNHKVPVFDQLGMWNWTFNEM